MLLKKIKYRIDLIAKVYCEDYPNIEKCQSLEQLYAIESKLKAQKATNEDLHKIIKVLKKKLNIPDNGMSEL